MKKIFFIILLLIILCSLFAVRLVLADYEIEVAIPGGPDIGAPVTLIEYIRYIYLFGLGLVGIAALGALVYGGFTYMLSDTITSKDDAKKYIWGAISGLVLALAAYLILNTINPDLIRLREPTLPAPSSPAPSPPAPSPPAPSPPAAVCTLIHDDVCPIGQNEGNCSQPGCTAAHCASVNYICCCP